MSNSADLKSTIMSSLDDLPADSLATLADFTSFLRAKSRHQTRPRVVKLRGLWSNAPAITGEDIAATRRELWGSFGDRQV